jgi:hypothetical protein
MRDKGPLAFIVGLVIGALSYGLLLWLGYAPPY